MFLADEVTVEAKPKFNPFSGSGRRLDGNPLKYHPSSDGNSFSSSASISRSNARQGKVVFGSDVFRTQEIGKVNFNASC